MTVTCVPALSAAAFAPNLDFFICYDCFPKVDHSRKTLAQTGPGFREETKIYGGRTAALGLDQFSWSGPRSFWRCATGASAKRKNAITSPHAWYKVPARSLRL